MKKKTLQLEALEVESFETMPDAALVRGTVHGAGASEETDCESCEGSCGLTFCLMLTCGTSCDGTCGDSCHGSCVGETCAQVCTGIFTC